MYEKKFKNIASKPLLDSYKITWKRKKQNKPRLSMTKLSVMSVKSIQLKASDLNVQFVKTTIFAKFVRLKVTTLILCLK